MRVGISPQISSSVCTTVVHPNGPPLVVHPTLHPTPPYSSIYQHIQFPALLRQKLIADEATRVMEQAAADKLAAEESEAELAAAAVEPNDGAEAGVDNEEDADDDAATEDDNTDVPAPDTPTTEGADEDAVE
jgi:type IV secretory pathway VirB10-like protein